MSGRTARVRSWLRSCSTTPTTSAISSASPVGPSILVGLACSLLLTRFLGSLLYQVSPYDPLTLGGIALVLILCSFAACYLPARRATAVDPAITLAANDGQGDAVIRLANLDRAYQAGPTAPTCSAVSPRRSARASSSRSWARRAPGKSTLLEHPRHARRRVDRRVRFLHHPVHSLNNKERVAINKQYIGFVFQQYHLLDDLTVAENLDVPLSYRNVKPQGARVDRRRRRSTSSRWWARRISIRASSPADSSSSWASRAP